MSRYFYQKYYDRITLSSGTPIKTGKLHKDYFTVDKFWSFSAIPSM